MAFELLPFSFNRFVINTSCRNFITTPQCNVTQRKNSKWFITSLVTARAMVTWGVVFEYFPTLLLRQRSWISFEHYSIRSAGTRTFEFLCSDETSVYVCTHGRIWATVTACIYRSILKTASSDTFITRGSSSLSSSCHTKYKIVDKWCRMKYGFLGYLTVECWN